MNKLSPSRSSQKPKKPKKIKKPRSLQKVKESEPAQKKELAQKKEPVQKKDLTQEAKTSRFLRTREAIKNLKILDFIKSLFWWTTLPIMLLVIGYALNQSAIPANLEKYGILSQGLGNSLKILFSPFVHTQLDHFVSNLISLWTLLLLLSLFYKKFYWLVLVLTLLFSELFIWIVGEGGPERGSNGIIYGLAAFIFFSGFLQRRMATIFASFVIFSIYHYLIMGLFPQQDSTANNIPYSSHWSGVVSGLMIALMMAYANFKRFATLKQK